MWIRSPLLRRGRTRALRGIITGTSRARSLALLLSVSDLRFPPIFWC